MLSVSRLFTAPLMENAHPATVVVVVPARVSSTQQYASQPPAAAQVVVTASADTSQQHGWPASTRQAYEALYAMRYMFSFWLSFVEIIFTLLAICIRGESIVCCVPNSVRCALRHRPLIIYAAGFAPLDQNWLFGAYIDTYDMLQGINPAQIAYN